MFNDKSLTDVQRDQLTGKKRQLQEDLKSLAIQLALLNEKRKHLRVFSPISGKISTLDVRDRLIHRPVERGQQLLSVAHADPNNPKDWELDVRMPEDRMGHIIRALNELRAEYQKNNPGGAEPPNLPVTFIMANDPGVEYHGVVKEIHNRAEVYEEEGNTVMIKVSLDGAQMEHLRAGAGIVAQVHCGTRSIGYVWFHDLWEFIQSRVLFRFF